MYHKNIISKTYVSGFLYESLGVNQGVANSPDVSVEFLVDVSQNSSKSCGIVINTEILVMYFLWADDLVLMLDCEEGYRGSSIICIIIFPRDILLLNV